MLSRPETVARSDSCDEIGADFLRLEHPALLQRHKSVVAEDDVVEELDAEERGAFVGAERDAAVFGAGAGVAAGMAPADLRQW